MAEDLYNQDEFVRTCEKLIDLKDRLGEIDAYTAVVNERLVSLNQRRYEAFIRFLNETNDLIRREEYVPANEKLTDFKGMLEELDARVCRIKGMMEAFGGQRKDACKRDTFCSRGSLDLRQFKEARDILNNILEKCQSDDATAKDLLARMPRPDFSGMTWLCTNPQGLEEYKHIETGIVFVLIPGNRFQAGGNENKCDNHLHDAEIGDFLLGKYTVTQAEWRKIMVNSPSFFKGDNNPVESVTWDECKSFCDKVGLRLPTVAEWEYACRAGTTTRFYWGDIADADYLWDSSNSGRTTHPVGQKKPNAFGLYDMNGNVWEWCADWFEENKISPENKPCGPSGEQERTLRGGSCINFAHICRPDFRISSVPNRHSYIYGVRCAAPAK